MYFHFDVKSQKPKDCSYKKNLSWYVKEIRTNGIQHTMCFLSIPLVADIDFLWTTLSNMFNVYIYTFFYHSNSPQGSTPALLTPTAKRKNLLLQHQQRSSMDTDALELEDHFSDQVSFDLKMI